MAVTKSWAAQPALAVPKHQPAPRSGLLALFCASLFIAAGLLMAYAAKSQAFTATDLVNVNTVASPDDLLPLLDSFSDRAERQSVADGAYEFLLRKRPLANIGALAPLRRGQRFPLARLKPLMIVSSNWTSSRASHSISPGSISSRSSGGSAASQATARFYPPCTCSRAWA